jgi:glycosyltransferase involved in cell wall biosynthesis
MSELVSIIIPCYNTEAFVAKAIESALSQSYDPIEVIVVDDGSTDDSLNVIESFGDRIKWKTGENQGVSAARNRGINLANGEFVKFLDADDILPEHSVATQVRQIQKARDKRVSVFGDGCQIDSAGQVLGKSNFRCKRAEEDPITYILSVNPGTQYPLHRRKHLVEIGGFDEDLPWAEDYDLHLRLQLKGILMKYCAADVVHVRQHGGEDRLTNRKTKEFEENPWAAYERGKDRERKIRESHSGNLPGAVSQHLAKGFWSSGRRALKAGHPVIAERFFDHARELHSQHIASSSTAYHVAIRLLGPRWAERLAQVARRAQRTANAFTS